MSRASVFALLALGAASAAAGPVLAQDAGADRYGPPSAVQPNLRAPSGYMAPDRGAVAAPSRLRGRMLSWPGKVDGPVASTAAYVPAAAQAYPAAGRAYAPGPERTAYAPPAARYRVGDQPGYAFRAPPAQLPAPQGAPTSLQARVSQERAAQDRVAQDRAAQERAAQDGWRPVFAAAPPNAVPSDGAALAGAPTRADLPSSIYAPRPAAVAANAAPRSAWAGSRAAGLAPPLHVAAADRRYGYDPTQEHGVRFYSVHRPFGLKPDAAPIPPQFFTATADLAEPPGPLPTDHTTVSGGVTHTSRVVSDPSAN